MKKVEKGFGQTNDCLFILVTGSSEYCMKIKNHQKKENQLDLMFYTVIIDMFCLFWKV
jgi:hypothetical protein